MAVIAILATYLGRPNLALRTLFVAGFAMLLWNPLLLTRDPSFQLSFLATLGLILFSPIVSTFLPVWISEKFGLREIVSSTIAVQIFLLPFLIHMSGMFSLISFVINLFVLPLIPFTMLAGFLTGFMGLFGKAVSFPFGALAYGLTECILSLVESSARLPLAAITVGSVSLFFVIGCYSMYGIFWWKFRDTVREERGT